MTTATAQPPSAARTAARARQAGSADLILRLGIGHRKTFMVTIGLDEARADMASVLDRVERGEDVLITRRPRQPASPARYATMEEALRELDALRASMPPWSKPSAELLRELRDEGY